VQLSISLADLAIQMTDWKDPVNDISVIFSGDDDMLSCFLAFLLVLPEECCDNRYAFNVKMLLSLN
jgi:transportin-3